MKVKDDILISIDDNDIDSNGQCIIPFGVAEIVIDVPLSYVPPPDTEPCNRSQLSVTVYLSVSSSLSTTMHWISLNFTHSADAL